MEDFYDSEARDIYDLCHLDRREKPDPDLEAGCKGG